MRFEIHQLAYHRQVLQDKPVFVNFLLRYSSWNWDKQMKRGTSDNKDAGAIGWDALCGAVCVRVYFDLEEKKKAKIDYYRSR